VASTDNDRPAVYLNLLKARKRWMAVSRVLGHKGSSPMTSGVFYKVVVQSVLLYGCETWDFSEEIRQTLEHFHHWVARRLSGLVPYFVPMDKSWVYPPIREALAKCGLESIEQYVCQRQHTFVDKISTGPFLNLCRSAERRAGTYAKRRLWWQQFQLE
jgi:hypothetical protein